MAERTQKTTTLSRKLRGKTRASKSWSEDSNSALAEGDFEKTQGVGHQGKDCQDGKISWHHFIHCVQLTCRLQEQGVQAQV